MKETYETPEVEITEVNVEKGFAQTLTDPYPDNDPGTGGATQGGLWDLE